MLRLELEDGQIKLQDHIVQKINNFTDKLKDLKTLQSFLRLLNYVRLYIKNLSRLAGPFIVKQKIQDIDILTKKILNLYRK